MAADNRDNVEFMTELMQFSRSGPLMQAFVIEAVSRYAQDVIASDMQDTPYLSAAAWKRCAQEAVDKIVARHGSEVGSRRSNKG